MYIINMLQIVSEAPEIKWHLIGHLQSNKCNAVAGTVLSFCSINDPSAVVIVLGIPNLWIVETVDSQKLADTLNSSCLKRERQERLRIFIQVNTSREES
jgi:uncharacterized pyridoxal phosphate-containing UPF0001 family protein